MTFKYIAFYKPYGVLSHFTDDDGRETLSQYINVPGIYAAGRLDWDSEGLMLLTDDGSLIHRLTTPKYHQPKIYWVQVEGCITPEAIASLAKGVVIQGTKTLPCQVMRILEPDLPPRRKPITPHAEPAWIQITLNEGRKRQIRHMTAAVGFPTLRLVRVAIGPLRLAELKPGLWRNLSVEETNQLISTAAGLTRST
jgi:23S rRNA pseudouridine2457 synthase